MRDEKLDKMQETIRKSQSETVKAIVKEVMEQLDSLETQKNDLQNKVRVLKHCLVDLKEGRLDRILERQQVDTESRTIIGLAISLIQSNSGAPSKSPWYTEYDVCMSIDGKECKARINNSVTRLHASGTYRLKNGQVKYL